LVNCANILNKISQYMFTKYNIFSTCVQYFLIDSFIEQRVAFVGLYLCPNFGGTVIFKLIGTAFRCLFNGRTNRVILDLYS